jgi:hypothetical protein
MARCVWALADKEVVEHLCATTKPRAKEWIFSMIKLLPHGDFMSVLVILWAIWNAMHEGVFQSPLSTHYFVQS